MLLESLIAGTLAFSPADQTHPARPDLPLLLSYQKREQAINLPDLPEFNITPYFSIDLATRSFTLASLHGHYHKRKVVFELGKYKVSLGQDRCAISFEF